MMDIRLEELLERMVAPGPFPQISASEGHEVYDLTYILEAELEKMKAENAEWELSFQLFDNAICRGDNLYRDAHPESKLILPSTDKLVLWLIEDLAAKTAKCEVCKKERKELSMLVRMLMPRLDRDKDAKLLSQCRDYLKRHGLQGDIFRVSGNKAALSGGEDDGK